MERNVLVMSDVTKSYKKQTIIDHFSFSAREGEVIALLGVNGAGKSTIIKMISGIIPPTKGTITVSDQTLKKNRGQYAKEISYMPDHFQFQQKLTVYEFLQYYAEIRKVNKDRVLEAIEMVGLLEKKDQYISTLSKGMGQRLLFAQVLFGDASLILLDEPTNGLDDEWMLRLKELILMLKETKKTVVISTHNQDFADEVSDRIIRISGS